MNGYRGEGGMEMTHFVVFECVEKLLICMMALLKHAEKKLVIDT